MQPIAWYVRRLGRMSPAEIGWRMRAAARDVSDVWRVARNRHPAPPLPPAAAATRLSQTPVGAWAGAAPGSREARWRDDLVRRATALAAHRLSFFNLRDRHLGDPIDWNRDHERNQATPLRFAPWIDYRDPEVAGDAKVVWEPNRHHQLVVLGRAYRATGRLQFAQAVVEQLDSWMRQCPYGRGMNWRSPLELAIRLINWVWALDLIAPSGLVRGALAERLHRSMYLHLWDLTRKYSRESSANNHRLGEAAGVFVATAWAPAFANERRWRDDAREILVEEALRQSYADGGGREQALSYQLFVLQFLLLANHAAGRNGMAFPAAFGDRVRKMLEFVAAIGEAGPPPMFGDSDDGYVIDLGGRGAAPAVLAAGAAVLDCPALAPPDESLEPAFWLLGSDFPSFVAARTQDRAGAARTARTLRSRAFEETGLYLLQSGDAGGRDALSVLFDAAELGYGSLAAHGHADALSFTVRAFGTDVLVDPGTYDYFTARDWRNYFRSTRAHNTVVIDGMDQSVMLGPFMWGARAGCRVLEWKPTAEGGTIAAEHDGYTRLPDPVLHRRRLTLDARDRTIVIRDELTARRRHQVEICFHFAECCRIIAEGPSRLEIGVNHNRCSVELDPRTTVRILRGSTEPPGGWVSRGYHSRTAAITIVAYGELAGAGTFTTRFRFEPHRP